MRRRFLLRCGVLAGLVALLPVFAPGASARIPGCDVDDLDDRCESWTAVYDHPGGHGGGGDDWMTAMAVDPDGDLVYVVGESWDDGTFSYDFAIQALDAVTGREVWRGRFGSEGARYDSPTAIAVDHAGETVIVAGGYGATDEEPSDFLTVALDADSGSEIWRAVHDGPGDDADWPAALAVSHDGRSVFVVGHTHAVTPDLDLTTVAYDLSSGALVWEATHRAPEGDEIAAAAVATPEGVVVAGTSWLGGSSDYVLVAYDVDEEDGLRERWSARHDGGAGRDDELVDLAVAPDASSVYVTGTAQRGGTTVLNRSSDIETVAFEARTGQRRWRTSYSGTSEGLDYAYEVTTGSRTGTVYVTGTVATDHRRAAFGTFALDPRTGSMRWVTKSLFVWGQGAVGLAVTPDESRVLVTGHSSSPVVGTATGVAGVYLGKADYTTVALRADDGSEVWAARYSETLTRTNFDLSYGVAVSPDGRRAFVAGVFGNRGDPNGDPLDGWNASNDFGTVAYDV